MRPTFLAFQIASRAMAASQANIDVTGNNMANVTTDGYTRQRVDQSSISSSGYTQKYSVPGTATGQGVEVTGISQIRDVFLDARFRTQSAESGYYDELLSGLNDLQNVYDEAATDGLQNELLNFVNQLQTFSQNPASQDLALVVRTAAQKVTQIMNTFANQTAAVRDQEVNDLSKIVVGIDFNTTVKSIAQLNTQIRDELTHGNVPNELYDKRNLLIDKLSGMANIKVTTTPEKVSEDLTIENLNISIYDNVSGKSIGVVQNGLYNTLSASLNKTTNSMEISINPSFGDYNGDITSYVTGGSMKGYLDLINGRGTYADTTKTPSENTFRGTLYYENAMNTLASNFSKVLNDLNSALGSPKPLFSASDGSGTITAANIGISKEWYADSTYITTTTGSANAGDNILRMKTALTEDMSYYKDPSNTSSQVMFVGTINEYMRGMLGELSLDIELHETFSDTATTVLNNLYTSREAISGISMNEEEINLMAYQKSYNAAARYFNVLDEAVDKIINEMGLVGR